MLGRQTKEYLDQLDDVSRPYDFQVVLNVCLVGCQGNRGIYNPLFSHEAGFNFVNTRGTRHSPDLKEEVQGCTHIKDGYGVRNRLDSLHLHLLFKLTCLYSFSASD